MRCWKCNKTIEEGHIYAIGKRAYCESCGKNEEKENVAELEEYLRLKTKLMVKRAIRIMENQELDIYEYKDAIEAVTEYAEADRNKFMSAHEVVAAIILVENRVQSKPQARIGKMHVDFKIDEFKCVLEIDGYMHPYHKRRDENREQKLKRVLGDEWETVRIKTEYIEQNATMLVEAIKAVLKEKRAGKL